MQKNNARCHLHDPPMFSMFSTCFIARFCRWLNCTHKNRPILSIIWHWLKDDTRVYIVCVVVCSSWHGGSECSINCTVCWITERLKQLWSSAWRHCILAAAGGDAVDWVITNECAPAACYVISLPVSCVHQSHGPCCRNLLWYVFLSRFVISWKCLTRPCLPCCRVLF